MSRAVSTVLTKGAVAAVRVSQARAMVVKNGVPGRGCPEDAGSGSTLAAPAADVPHRRGSLAPVPRGSKLTTSKRSGTVGGNFWRRTGRSSFPLSPGPPGFMTRVPIGGADPVAGARVTARVIDPDPGWA